jgi:hypothetical protein
MLAVFAAFETDVRRERQLVGIAMAKRQVSTRAGKRASIRSCPAEAWGLQPRSGASSRGVGPAAIARELAMARSSVYRLLTRHRRVLRELYQSSAVGQNFRAPEKSFDTRRRMRGPSVPEYDCCWVGGRGEPRRESRSGSGPTATGQANPLKHPVAKPPRHMPSFTCKVRLQTQQARHCSWQFPGESQWLGQRDVLRAKP